jgi:ubiquinone/menaquinone biosynthesis C-methylase UbiE
MSAPRREDREEELRRVHAQAPDAYWEERRRHYRDAGVASAYDAHRFAGARGRRNRAKWSAIASALALAGDVREVLDLPTGTGRFVPQFLASGRTVVGADISRDMMRQAREKAAAGPGGLAGLVQCDVERLPFRDRSFDAAVTIRFLMHLPPEVRVRALSELARVSRRWVIADYRHRYTVQRALRRVACTLGLASEPPPRVSRRQMEAELRAAGLRVVRVFPIARLFSEKWVVLCARA